MVSLYADCLKLAKPFRSGKDCFVPVVKRHNCGHITVSPHSQLAAGGTRGPKRWFPSKFRIS